jgi:hypothetical protein
MEEAKGLYLTKISVQFNISFGINIYCYIWIIISIYN